MNEVSDGVLLPESIRVDFSDSVNKETVRGILTEVARIRVNGVYAREFLSKVPPDHPYSKALVAKLLLNVKHERNQISDDDFLSEATEIERELYEASKSLRRAEIA